MPMKATVHWCIFIPCITYLYEKKVALLFISLLPDLVRFFNPYSQSTHQTEICWSDLLQSFCPYSAVIYSRLLLWPFILVLFLRAWSARYHHILLDAQTISCCQVWHRIKFHGQVYLVQSTNCSLIHIIQTRKICHDVCIPFSLQRKGINLAPTDRKSVVQG